MGERDAERHGSSESAHAQAPVSIAGRVAGNSGRLGRAALPLILSDAVLQGSRYLLILYLGPSQQITIDQVRGLDEFLSVGTHRAGLKIVLINPAGLPRAPPPTAPS